MRSKRQRKGTSAGCAHERSGGGGMRMRHAWRQQHAAAAARRTRIAIGRSVGGRSTTAERAATGWRQIRSSRCRRALRTCRRRARCGVGAADGDGTRLHWRAASGKRSLRTATLLRCARRFSAWPDAAVAAALPPRACAGLRKCACRYSSRCSSAARGAARRIRQPHPHAVYEGMTLPGAASEHNAAAAATLHLGADGQDQGQRQHGSLPGVPAGCRRCKTPSCPRPSLRLGVSLAIPLRSTTTSQAPSPPQHAAPCRALSSSRWASRRTRTRPSTS